MKGQDKFNRRQKVGKVEKFEIVVRGRMLNVSS